MVQFKSLNQMLVNYGYKEVHPNLEMFYLYGTLEDMRRPDKGLIAVPTVISGMQHFFDASSLDVKFKVYEGEPRIWTTPSLSVYMIKGHDKCVDNYELLGILRTLQVLGREMFVEPCDELEYRVRLFTPNMIFPEQ